MSTDQTGVMEYMLKKAIRDALTKGRAVERYKEVELLVIFCDAQLNVIWREHKTEKILSLDEVNRRIQDHMFKLCQMGN